MWCQQQPLPERIESVMINIGTAVSRAYTHGLALFHCEELREVTGVLVDSISVGGNSLLSFSP